MSSIKVFILKFAGKNSNPLIPSICGAIERSLNPILGGRVGKFTYPSVNVAVTSEKMPRRGWFFATFSFYLLDTICEIFGIRACLERKLQTISQQDVTRTVWIPIVKHQSKIVNNFWLDDCLDLKFSQCHCITKRNFSWNFHQNPTTWRHYDVIGHFCRFCLEHYLE